MQPRLLAAAGCLPGGWPAISSCLQVGFAALYHAPHGRDTSPVMNTKTIFFLLLILSATGTISPPIALCAGIAFGLACAHPYAADARALARFLLQASVVALGFGMNL